MGWRKFGAASLVFLSLGLMVLPGAGQARRQAEIEVRPANPTEDDSITLVLSGRWPNSCTPESPRVRATGSRITVETSNSSEACLQKITPWELKVPVGELSADTYRVTVNFEGETIGRERFEVEESEPELVDLEVEPSSLGLGVGEQEQLISWAIYHHNGLGEKKDVTDEARWRSSDTSVAVVSKGLVSGEGPGEARINAIYEGERG
ncbi:MAG: Ig-like domain-containing protein, partial [Candidatus Bipolaricaulota bacterium]